MSRQRGDIYERGPGPLFEPSVSRLYGRTDPVTSRKSARGVLQSGTAQSDAAYLAELINRHPGSTMERYGVVAADERGGDPYRWRLKLGRRTGTILEARAAHTAGEENGMSRWWPGPDPERGDT